MNKVQKVQPSSITSDREGNLKNCWSHIPGQIQVFSPPPLTHTLKLCVKAPLPHHHHSPIPSNSVFKAHSPPPPPLTHTLKLC